VSVDDDSPGSAEQVSQLPIVHNSLDWSELFAKYPVPDVFERTVYRWSPERIRRLQSERFLELIELGWQNPFYSRRWSEAGLKPGDVRHLDDIVHLPIFTSEDIKNDQLENPPFGLIHTGAMALRGKVPLKVHTSGGTTGKPRPTLYGPLEWELNGLSFARGTYIQGGRPGDIHQIPSTNSLANFGWCVYKASHDYLGIIPLTTGSGVVTPSRRQLEIAFDWGTNIWTCFPEYLTQLAKVARDELGRDVRELNTKFIQSFLGPDTDNTLRDQLEALWGCPVYDHYGAHEQGLGAFECQYKAGLHFMEDTCYFEVLDLETRRPVPKGQSGNLVVTILFRSIPPIIRMNVQDVGRILYEEQCECGSYFRRMDKFLGRSDSMVKLRGTNVFPMACLPGVKSDNRTTGEWICVVDRSQKDGVLRDEMTVRIEVRKDAPSREGLQAHLERRLHSDLGVRVLVELVDEGSLAEIANLGREGKPRRLIDRRFVKA
jgi:phenylacetate-CoA ligase